ncbi:MAG: S-adenosylmethionine decarboxylase proenzyme [Myxococcales bacterium]|nr:S-adenosylmethionine decarboxylase proenzyme [Myxococcales bacterium]
MPPQTPTLFEGPEKKVELVVRDGSRPLRAYGDAHWRSVVEASRASILSTMRSDECDAYLLSESSLFVWDDRLIMLTCGRTRLVDGVEEILRTLPDEEIAMLVYERKNEHFPEEQPTTFVDDARRLDAHLGGGAFVFGEPDAHRVFLFHSMGDYRPAGDDTTLEVLMHGIHPRWAERLRPSERPEGSAMAAALGIDRLIPGFEIDEHIFDPLGYSLNAIRGQHYFTIHATPQQVGSYVSFETNVDFRAAPSLIPRRVVELFEPTSFDIVSFAPGSEQPSFEIPGYRLRQHVEQAVAGYQVGFRQFYRPPRGPEAALVLDL